MKKILLSLVIIITVLIVVLFYRANTAFENHQYQVTEPLTTIKLDENAVVQRLSKAIQIPTISMRIKRILIKPHFTHSNNT
ncbi:hypothetical protein [Paraglaciecola sp.]|uniref:hypothetical protein n=1 Tax=Paraglaciecola sp. TaxID=1920173 RepID=UPI0030F3C7D5